MTSSITDESEKWFDFDHISVPVQSIDEILADQNNLFDEEFSGFEEDESIFSQSIDYNCSTLSYKLRCSIFLEKWENVSHQIAAASNRQNSGIPTALASSSMFLAVGTSRGFVLIFEQKSGKLFQYISPEPDSSSIASLDFSLDDSKLIVGQTNGIILIVVCGVTNKKPKKIFDIFQTGHGILQLKYIMNNDILVVDNHGSVYQLREGRKFFWKFRCIFSDFKNEIVNICVIQSLKLVCFLSPTKHFFFSLKNRCKLVQQINLSNVLSPPLLDYYCSSYLANSKTQICLAQNNIIQIYEVKLVDTEISLILNKTIKLEHKLINLKWIDKFFLFGITDKEKFLLIDVEKGQVVEKTSFPQLKLIYNNSNFKSLSTGACVSNTFIKLSEYVCYQSVIKAEFNKIYIYILDEKGIFKISLIDQFSQFKLFIESNQISSALLYASDIYNGVIVDKTVNQNLKEIIATHLPQLIDKYLQYVIDESSKITLQNKLIEFYKQNIMILQRVCVFTANFDTLYYKIYTQLAENSSSKLIFLELLDEYVREGQLYQPPAFLVNDYLTFLIAESHHAEFENAIIKFPISNIDFHYVITNCRKNCLFDGIAYIMNNALNDFLGPLKEMFEKLNEFINKEVFSDLEINQGNKLLLYINCCLNGRSYFSGDFLKDNLETSVSCETYNFLIQEKTLSPTSDALSNNNNTFYPYIKLLLKFDSAQFLNVISTCIDAPVFLRSAETNTDDEDKLKHLINILIKIFERSTEAEVYQLGENLLFFLLTILKKNAIKINVDNVNKFVKIFLERPNERLQINTEQSIIELMTVLERVDQNEILEIASKKHYILICAFILMKYQKYIELLDLCFETQYNKNYMFVVIKKLLTLTESQKITEIRNYVKEKITELNNIDSLKTADLILNNFIEYFNNVDNLPILLIHSCFEIQQSKNLCTITNNEVIDEKLFEIFFMNLLEMEINTNFNFNLKNKNDFTIDNYEEMESIDLKLSKTLNYWLPIGSRTEYCLNLTETYYLLQCRTMILVSKNKKSEAFQKLFSNIMDKNYLPKTICKKVNLIVKLAEKCYVDARNEQWFLKVFYHLLSMIQKELEKNDNSLSLVDYNSNISKTVNSSDEHCNQEFQEQNVLDIILNLLLKVFNLIVEINSEDLEKIVIKILSNPILTNKRYISTLKKIIDKIFSICELEEFMYDSANKYINFEVCNKIRSAVVSSQQLFANDVITSSICVRCCKHIKKSFFIFNCGHLLHMDCAENKVEFRHCNLCIEGGIEVESDAPLSDKCLEHWQEWLNASPNNLNSTPTIKKQSVNIIDMIDSQVLRLGPPPPTLLSFIPNTYNNPFDV